MKIIGPLGLCVLFLTLFFSTAFASLKDPRIGERAHIFRGLSEPISPTKRVFIFGDSLSDSDKRLQTQTKGAVPPLDLYWEGHFTNGPTWNEYFANAIGVTPYSYALGGARIIEVNNYYVIPPTMKHLWSEGAYAQIGKIDDERIRFSEEDLIGLWIGGNDYLLFPNKQKIDNLVWHTKNIIMQLMRRGATRFMVLNVPDVTQTPWYTLRIADVIMTAKQARPLVTEHNEKLSAAIDELRKEFPNTKITLVDTFSALGELLDRRDSLALSEVKNPCIGGEFLPKSVQADFLYAKDFPRVQCKNPESHFYWDPWHPTTKVHCLTAVKVLSTLMEDQVITPFNYEETLQKCLQ